MNQQRQLEGTTLYQLLQFESGIILLAVPKKPGERLPDWWQLWFFAKAIRKMSFLEITGASFPRSPPGYPLVIPSSHQVPVIFPCFFHGIPPSSWWFGTWLDYVSPIFLEFHDPNWRTPSFFRGIGIPPTSYCWKSGLTNTLKIAHQVPLIPIVYFSGQKPIVSDPKNHCSLRKNPPFDWLRFPLPLRPGRLHRAPLRQPGSALRRRRRSAGARFSARAPHLGFALRDFTTKNGDFTNKHGKFMGIHSKTWGFHLQKWWLNQQIMGIPSSKMRISPATMVTWPTNYGNSMIKNENFTCKNGDLTNKLWRFHQQAACQDWLWGRRWWTLPWWPPEKLCYIHWEMGNAVSFGNCFSDTSQWDRQ